MKDLTQKISGRTSALVFTEIIGENNNKNIILPRKLRSYLNVKDGANVILRFNPPDDEELIVMAQAFWYPKDHDLWDLFEPCRVRCAHHSIIIFEGSAP